jgi:beta-galactosidase
MGCNALRTSHNPPAPELLDIADCLGFIVLDEIFDCWTSSKTTNDFHMIFETGLKQTYDHLFDGIETTLQS